ncbi:MAG: putative toxin-antitoxin system toxin component, PIN family [Acidobacteriota bacterium]
MSPTGVVFDTNILLSAFLFGGKPQALFEAVRSGKIELLTTPSILAEFASILGDKFSWEDKDVREALIVIGRHAELVKPKQKIALLEDDADNRVLECALEGSADFIISGDRHLLNLREFRGIPILRAAGFLAELV